MINIHFIVPYPELEIKVNRIFQDHPQSSKLHKTVSIMSGDFEFGNGHIPIDQPCDVIIARGYAASQVRHNQTHIPVIELPITGYDVFNSLYTTIQRFHPQRIALIGSFSSACTRMNLSGIFGCEIHAFSPRSAGEIDAALEAAIEHGCDIVIGVYSIHLRAIEYHIPSLVIEVSEEAIMEAIDNAVRAAELRQSEREKTEVTKVVLQSVKDGFLYVNPQRRITMLNHAAERLYHGPLSTLVGCRIDEVFPFVKSDLATVLSGTEIPNQLYKMDAEADYLAAYQPVWVGAKLVGVIVNLQNVATVQQNETQVRKKLSDKGLRAKYNFSDIIYRSKAMEQLVQTAQKYAEVSSNILIVGETGTGKELMAQSIHNHSSRELAPFVAINCATLPENLLESELFGHVEGAFTGTVKGGKIGLFELANNGTLFLDEISEIPLSFQSKLLRALQENEIRRVGDNRVISIDVRVIAATNKNLKNLVDQGLFRRDLLYRLEILKLYIPPLRRRQEDIILLFRHFLGQYNQSFGGVISEISPQALYLLENAPFSGNIRELKNVAERLSVNCKGQGYVGEQEMREALSPRDVENEERPSSFLLHSPEDEQQRIENALQECGYNQSRAARLLGINRSTLWRKMQKYHLS